MTYSQEVYTPKRRNRLAARTQHGRAQRWLEPLENSVRDSVSRDKYTEGTGHALSENVNKIIGQSIAFWFRITSPLLSYFVARLALVTWSCLPQEP